MSTVTIAEMQDAGKLITLDEAMNRLAETEPLVPDALPVGPGVHFELGPAWAAQAEASDDGGSLVDAHLFVGEKMYAMTKDALLQATSLCGIPKSYATRPPAKLIEQHLDYWFTQGLAGKEFQILAANDTALAVTKQSIVPFSNISLVEKAVESIHQKYGTATDVLVDNKFTHSLPRTHLRLIIPETERQIERTGTDNDLWSIGVQVRNSLTGEDRTSFDGYLFRFWCANGQIDVHQSSGMWSRKGGQGEEVYEWARNAVDSILGGLEGSLDQVQKLVDIPIAGEVRDVLDDVFEQYSLSVHQRKDVIDQMVEEDSLTMYALVAAITRVANDSALAPKHVDRLMRVGGDLVYTAQSRCDACHRLQRPHHSH